MNEPLKVLQKDGISYIELGSWNTVHTQINGELATKCPGNDKWVMVEGEVHSINEVKFIRGKVTRFQLAERYKGIVPNLPETQPLDAFEFSDCGDIIGELSEFYVKVRAESTEELEPREWLVIDVDCEPMQMPDYVKVKFPNSLKQYTQTHHKYPCSIGMPDVFILIWDRITEIVDGSNRKYGRDNFKDIQTLKVWENVPVDFPLYTRVTRFARTKRGKDKVENVKKITVEVPVFNLLGTYRSTSDRDIQIQEVHGEDYKNLQEKLEQYIQSFLILLDKDKREVCPHCEGTGIITEELAR